MREGGGVVAVITARRMSIRLWSETWLGMQGGAVAVTTAARLRRLVELEGGLRGT